jgi:NAD(P)-dependent dehydrogenase (short-subunit alcohol dehydrogenase family)
MARPAADGAKIVLVTGAARRIGRAVALGMARAGWDVCVHYHRSQAEADQLVGELCKLGVRAAAVCADLTDAAQVQGIIARCAQLLGAPHCLVNNASRFEYDSLTSLSTQSWDAHLDVNLRAPILLARDFARALPMERDGCIINMLDQKVFNLNPDFFSYTIAKIGLAGATRMLALALAPRIRVCAVAPGLTLLSGDQNQENFDKAHLATPLGRAGDMDDIVATVLYLVSTGSLTGETISVDGGQRLVPMERDVMFKF